MKKILLVLLLILFIVGCSETEPEVVDKVATPAIGDTFPFDGVYGIVVGVGDTPFEFTATGESLVLIDLHREGYKIVIVPEAGQKVAVEPKKPSLTIEGKEQLNEYSLPSTFVLVEYDRENS